MLMFPPPESLNYFNVNANEPILCTRKRIFAETSLKRKLNISAETISCMRRERKKAMPVFISERPFKTADNRALSLFMLYSKLTTAQLAQQFSFFCRGFNPVN